MIRKASIPQIKAIPLKELHFDPANPRLPSSIDGSAETEVLEWMLRYGRLPELMASIGEQGFFIAEPLLVVPRPDGGYWVVEGNRRLAAAKLLLNPTSASTRQISVKEIASGAAHRPEELPAIIYSSRDEILEYLGFRHITGVHEWDPLSKARYLEQMRQSLEAEGVKSKDMNRRLARLIGSRADYVQRLLLGLQVYERIANDVLPSSEIKVNENDISFSILTTALNYVAISEFLGITDEQGVKHVNTNHLAELTQWLFEKGNENRTRLGESRNLSLLAKVVPNVEALTEFRNGQPLRDAAVYADGPGSVMRKALINARGSLKAAHSAFPTVIDLTNEDLDLAKTVRVSAYRLENQIEAEFRAVKGDGAFGAE